MSVFTDGVDCASPLQTGLTELTADCVYKMTNAHLDGRMRAATRKPSKHLAVAGKSGRSDRHMLTPLRCANFLKAARQFAVQADMAEQDCWSTTSVKIHD